VPTILNVCGHADETHDGRPWAHMSTAGVSKKDAKLEHYTSRIEEDRAVLLADSVTPDVDTVLKGDELDAAAADLDIQGRASMTAEQKRKAVAEAQDAAIVEPVHPTDQQEAAQ
jgi:hypothetical protein